MNNSCVLIGPMLAVVLGQSELVRQTQIDPKDVKIHLEQVGPSPLPYQAIRLRLTLENVGKNRLGPIVPPEAGLARPALPKVKLPQEEVYRTFSVTVPTDGTASSGYQQSPPPNPPIFLNPGERISLSFSVPLAWCVDSDRNILFPGPGKYSVRYPYRFDPQKRGPEGTASASLDLEIREPQGDDKAVYDMLHKDKRLGSALLRRWATWELYPTLREITDKYPKSSYADYARLALARLFGKQPASEFLAAIPLFRLNDQNKWVTGYFAYQPDALMLTVAVDKTRSTEAMRHFDRYFPDAAELLRSSEIAVDRQTLRDALEQARAGREPESWEAFRKRPPAPPEKPADR